MKTIKEIKEDIKEIRYYFFWQKDFTSAEKNGIRSNVIDLAEKYNEIIKTAPANLFLLYINYVVNNNSQIVVSENLGVSIDYVKYLCAHLYEFIYKKINEEEV